MLLLPRSIFCTVAFLLVIPGILGSCRKDKTPSVGTHVKVKLINNDCMGTVLAILDDRFAHLGQADYDTHMNGMGKHDGAVWVQQSTVNWTDLTLGQEYYVDIQLIKTQSATTCYRMPGPPKQSVAVLKLY